MHTEWFAQIVLYGKVSVFLILMMVIRNILLSYSKYFETKQLMAPFHRHFHVVEMKLLIGIFPAAAGVNQASKR